MKHAFRMIVAGLVLLSGFGGPSIGAQAPPARGRTLS